MGKDEIISWWGGDPTLFAMTAKTLSTLRDDESIASPGLVAPSCT